MDRAHLPEDFCCERYLYLINIQVEATAQTVEALEATPDISDALCKSMELIEEVIAVVFEE